MKAELLSNFADDANKIGGWLLVYLVFATIPAIIYPGIFVAELLTDENYGNLGENGLRDFVFFVITLFVPASLYFRGHVWVPFVHTGINLLLGIALVFTVPPVGAWCLAWTFYWIRSNRVSLVYSGEHHVWGRAARSIDSAK